mmetsp:Transcript_1959/g.4741  ORF Transcript_1959/g.4741 Transcript_1959/m.4741 type:complete len:293 (-) Transcript_1959:42-920(-)
MQTARSTARTLGQSASVPPRTSAARNSTERSSSESLHDGQVQAGSDATASLRISPLSSTRPSLDGTQSSSLLDLRRSEEIPVLAARLLALHHLDNAGSGTVPYADAMGRPLQEMHAIDDLPDLATPVFPGLDSQPNSYNMFHSHVSTQPVEVDVSMQDVRSAAGQIRREDMVALRYVSKPPAALRPVVEALQTMGVIPACNLDNWMAVKKYITGPQLLSKIRALHPDTLSSAQFRKLRRVVVDSQVGAPHDEPVSKGVNRLGNWCRTIACFMAQHRFPESGVIPLYPDLGLR